MKLRNSIWNEELLWGSKILQFQHVFACTFYFLILFQGIKFEGSMKLFQNCTLELKSNVRHWRFSFIEISIEIVPLCILKGLAFFPLSGIIFWYQMPTTSSRALQHTQCLIRSLWSPFCDFLCICCCCCCCV